MARLIATSTLTIGLLALAFSPALADERFALLDKNRDGNVTWEEFHEANPSMPRLAFDKIDVGGKGYFDHKEWDNFISSHGKGMGQGMGQGVAMPPQNETLPARDAVPPVVMPPQKATTPQVAAPNAPVVMPPQKTAPPKAAGAEGPVVMPPKKSTAPGAAAPEKPVVMPPKKATSQAVPAPEAPVIMPPAGVKPTAPSAAQPVKP